MWRVAPLDACQAAVHQQRMRARACARTKPLADDQTVVQQYNRTSRPSMVKPPHAKASHAGLRVATVAAASWPPLFLAAPVAAAPLPARPDQTPHQGSARKRSYAGKSQHNLLRLSYQRNSSTATPVQRQTSDSFIGMISPSCSLLQAACPDTPAPTNTLTVSTMV